MMIKGEDFAVRGGGSNPSIALYFFNFFFFTFDFFFILY